MRMIPPTVTDGTKSGAERRVFRLLEKMELPRSFAFHSLSLSEHEYKRWGELDFVVLGPDALIVLEVKGGGIGFQDGVWEYTDRFGVVHHSSEGPFKQAQSGLMGLRDRLEEVVPAPDLDKMALGFGVVFPDAVFDIRSVEWSQWQIADRRRTSHGNFDVWLRHLITEWRTKLSKQESVSDVVVRTVRDVLRPNFDRVPPISIRVEDAIEAMDRLTEDQYQLLDALEENPRLVCDGGAGTGKTFLAMEAARRAKDQGARVLFATAGAGVSEFVRSRLPDTIDVSTYEALTSRSSASPQCDFLIADEAQDVLDADGLALLDEVVTDGLSNGRWAIFHDPNNQAAVAGRFDPSALAFLKETGAVRVRLHHNCRNTRPIVTETRLLTGADLGTVESGPGPTVEYAYSSDQPEQARQLEDHLASLLGAAVSPGDITILSPRDFDESAVAHMSGKMRRRITLLDPEHPRVAPWPDITYSTVRGFKGLENGFVSVTDIDWIDLDAEALATLYVAMSRARASLWLGVSETARDVLTSAAAGNVQAVLGKSARPVS